MIKHLPARPNLDHLRGQAKALLARLGDGDTAAATAFVEHLPAARQMTPAAARAASFRLADAQSVVARQNGFASWPQLARHVDALRALEGEWHFHSLQVDGTPVPADLLAGSRILMDGDRFRTESADGTYEGIFAIDTEQDPPHIDIRFVAGPHAGQTVNGIFAHDGDDLIFCLGLVGSPRPREFTTSPGSGHALERLHRASAARPANVNGGTPPRPGPVQVIERGDPAAFDATPSPLALRMQGEWVPTELVRDGVPLPASFLGMGTRTMTGNEVKVVFGGQTMVHAKVRVDESAAPIAIDYLDLRTHELTLGIVAWDGDDLCFNMAPAGVPRPTAFAPGPGTLSRWRKR